MPTVFLIFSSEIGGPGFVHDRLPVGVPELHAIIGLGPLERDIPLAHVFDDFFGAAAERVTEAAAARPFDSDDIVSLKAVIAEAGR